MTLVNSRTVFFCKNFIIEAIIPPVQCSLILKVTMFQQNVFQQLFVFEQLLINIPLLSPGDLKKHMFRHEAPKYYKCGICGDMFARKDTLQRHLEGVTHKGKDTLQRHLEGVTHKGKDTLQRHLEGVTHKGKDTLQR